MRGGLQRTWNVGGKSPVCPLAGEKLKKRARRIACIAFLLSGRGRAIARFLRQPRSRRQQHIGNPWITGAGSSQHHRHRPPCADRRRALHSLRSPLVLSSCHRQQRCSQHPVFIIGRSLARYDLRDSVEVEILGGRVPHASRTRTPRADILDAQGKTPVILEKPTVGALPHRRPEPAPARPSPCG